MAVAAIPIALTAASTAFGAIGQIGQQNAETQASRYNAQVLENNAQVARQNQEMQLDQAETEARRIENQGRGLLASSRTQAAKNGIDLTGSFEDVQFDNSIGIREDVTNTRYKANVGAWNSRVDEMRYRSQASLTRMQAASNRRSGLLDIGTTLLSGGMKAYGQYSNAAGSKSNPGFN